MSKMIRKPFSWLTLLAAFALVVGFAYFSACSGSDDDDATTPAGDDDDATTEITPTEPPTEPPTAAPCGDGTCDADGGEDCSSCAADCGACPTCGDGTCNGTEIAGADDTAPVCNTDCGPTVAITFVADTSTMADDANKLAEVLAGESMYVVGDMFPGGKNCWDTAASNYTCWAQGADLKMTEETAGSGIYKLTLNLQPGTKIEYKFAKNADANAADAIWNNGEKDFQWEADEHCTAWDAETPPPDPAAGRAGLWETGNFTYDVPTADATMDTHVVDAFRDYAESFGYPSCD